MRIDEDYSKLALATLYVACMHGMPPLELQENSKTKTDGNSQSECQSDWIQDFKMTAQGEIIHEHQNKLVLGTGLLCAQ